MKKRMMCLFMAVALTVGASMTAYAKDYQGKNTWLVDFDGKQMNSNFKSQDLADDAANIQPGDSIEFRVDLKNSSKDDMDWYMTNTVLEALEEDAVTNRGAYEYRLSYMGKDGTENLLYASSTVGGEGDGQSAESLRQATEPMKDYFYLTRLAAGEGGTLRLKIGIDGETQGNAYQDTLTRLQMNFAAEKVASPSTETRNRTVHTTVKTGDSAKVLLLSVMALLSGLVLLLYGLYLMKRQQAARRRRAGKGE